MKNLTAVFLLVALLSGCNSTTDNDNTKDADFIFGKWKNCKEKNTFLEFSKTGEYIVWINSETVENNPLKYQYDPTKLKDNFKLTDGKTIQKGTIEIIDKNRIKLSIYAINSKEICSSTEFLRISEK